MEPFDTVATSFDDAYRRVVLKREISAEKKKQGKRVRDSIETLASDPYSAIYTFYKPRRTHRWYSSTWRVGYDDSITNVKWPVEKEETKKTVQLWT